jgi:hypothetical protein
MARASPGRRAPARNTRSPGLLFLAEDDTAGGISTVSWWVLVRMVCTSSVASATAGPRHDEVAQARKVGMKQGFIIAWGWSNETGLMPPEKARAVERLRDRQSKSAGAIWQKFSLFPVDSPQQIAACQGP